MSKEADIQVKERGMHHQLGREAEKAFRGKAKHGAGGGESEDGYHSLGEDRHASIGYKGGCHSCESEHRATSSMGSHAEQLGASTL